MKQMRMQFKKNHLQFKDAYIIYKILDNYLLLLIMFIIDNFKDYIL